jgi:hypothetical protein
MRAAPRKAPLLGLNQCLSRNLPLDETTDSDAVSVSAHEVETDSCNAKPQQPEAWNTREGWRSFGNAKKMKKNRQALADGPESVEA